MTGDGLLNYYRYEPIHFSGGELPTCYLAPLSQIEYFEK